MGVSSFRLSSVKTGKKYRNFKIPTADYPPAATGGSEIVSVGGYRYHMFDSSSSLVVSNGGSFEILVIGAGGGGGKSDAGGWLPELKPFPPEFP